MFSLNEFLSAVSVVFTLDAKLLGDKDNLLKISIAFLSPIGYVSLIAKEHLQYF